MHKTGFFLAGLDGQLDDERIFAVYSGGVKTNRDAWVYNFSKTALTDTVEQLTGRQAQSVSSWLDDHVAEFAVKPSMSQRIGGFALKQKYRGDAMTD